MDQSECPSAFDTHGHRASMLALFVLACFLAIAMIGRRAGHDNDLDQYRSGTTMNSFSAELSGARGYRRSCDVFSPASSAQILR